MRSAILGTVRWSIVGVHSPLHRMTNDTWTLNDEQSRGSLFDHLNGACVIRSRGRAPAQIPIGLLHRVDGGLSWTGRAEPARIRVARDRGVLGGLHAYLPPTGVGDAALQRGVAGR